MTRTQKAWITIGGATIAGGALAGGVGIALGAVAGALFLRWSRHHEVPLLPPPSFGADPFVPSLFAGEGAVGSDFRGARDVFGQDDGGAGGGAGGDAGGGGDGGEGGGDDGGGGGDGGDSGGSPAPAKPSAPTGRSAASSSRKKPPALKAKH